MTVPVMLNVSLPKGEAGIIEMADGSRETVIAGSTPCYSVDGIRLDASLDEWNAKKPCLLRFPHQAKGVRRSEGVVWSGPNDLSARFWLGHDRESLYFAAEATDDRHAQSEKDNELWKGDSFQLAFFAAGKRYEFACGLRDRGALTVYQHAPKSGKPVGVTPAAKRAGNKTIYEVRIPLEVLGITLGSLGNTRFALLLNDNDGVESRSDQGAREGYLEWFEGIGLHKEPSRYPPLTQE